MVVGGIWKFSGDLGLWTEVLEIWRGICEGGADVVRVGCVGFALGEFSVGDD